MGSAIKLALGKLKIGLGYEAIFSGVLEANGFALLPSTIDHSRALIPLPRHHGDPFDRLIISQAIVEGLTIVTCDSAFPAYGVPLLW
jgi:PIN domain nuclease of toxin-antitoxin system